MKLLKFLALPFTLNVYVSFFPFDMINSNLWGSSHVPTKGGSRYYVYFIDDHTRYCWIYLMTLRLSSLRYTNPFVLL